VLQRSAVKADDIIHPPPILLHQEPWCCPALIALQYHEVKINIEWNDAKFIAGNFNNAKTLKQPVQAAVYVDYIYLDTEERRGMAQYSHEYLI